MADWSRDRPVRRNRGAREGREGTASDRSVFVFVTEEDGGRFTTPSIELSVTTTSSAPAYLTRGDRRIELVVEGLENGEWVAKYAKPIGDGGGSVLRLEPGESAPFETTIEGNLPGTCRCSQIINLEDGVYRFRIAQGYVDSFDEELFEFGEELPAKFRISNRFALDAPDSD